MTVLADMLDVARSIPIEHELSRRGVKLRGRVDRCGPCPNCGGTDRFSINRKKSRPSTVANAAKKAAALSISLCFWTDATLVER
jgi:hypothetical protein